MKLAVIGTGYVGLVTGTCFAEMGNDVVCVDIDENKVDKLRAGEITIFEPGLEIFFERNRREKRLSFTTSLQEAVDASDVIFLALPTPPSEDGSADLSYVLGVAGELGELLRDDPERGYKIVVNKSTVPVGTADRTREAIEAAGLTAGVDFDVVSNPEFLREGVAVDDFMKPERVVIGTSSDRAAETMTLLYEPFVRQGNPIMVMDERSAEMTKYAANAFLATKISFMNEIANLSEKVGANVDKIRAGIGSDSRIGKQFLYAGIGFGGSCFPKDVQALARTAGEYEYDFQILDSVLKVNDVQRALLAARVQEYFGGSGGASLEGRTIAVWGLAFKPNTDDVREAPSHIIIRKLLDAGARVKAFDPEAVETTRAVLGDEPTYATDRYEALEGADALVICTEWHEFRRPDFEKMKEIMKRPVIFDGRNVYEPKRMAELGFDYFSIGRPRVQAAG
ncbi:MAG: UDP-glucose/GDP-mannose dehydrogenase family protein [Rhodothermales bacterium]